MITIEGNKYGIIKNGNTEENLLAKQDEVYDFAWLMNMLGNGGFEIVSYSPGKQTNPIHRRDYNIFFCESGNSSLLVKFNYPDPYIVNVQIEVFEKTLADPSFRNVTDFLRDNGYPVYVYVPGEEGQDGSFPLYDFMDEVI